MEPRLLFSADVAGVLATDAPPAGLVLSETQIDLLVTGDPSAADTQTAADIQREVVFVDTSTPDYQQLVDDLTANRDNTRQLTVFYLDASRDGVEQISQVLSQQQGLSAVHLVSHGNDHALQLGNTWLDGDTLQDYRSAIQGWGSALAADADILVYGCELAGSDAGVALVDNLSQLTGADIAASNDLTGNTRLGGDWEFEYRTGGIETDVAFSRGLQESWSGVLFAVKAGSEFQINTTSASDQNTASVAMDSAGNFVVTWESQGQDGSGTGIFAQRYNAAGTPLGAEIQVNTVTGADQSNSQVAMANNGDFLVVWEGRQDGDANIYARLFDSTGTPQGAEFQINATTAGDQLNPAVAMKNNGDFVVAWQSDDGSGSGILARMFDKNGVAQTAEVQINSTTAGDQVNASVAIKNNGDFAVSWDSDGQDSDGAGVFARLFDKNGAPQTAEIQVNETVAGDQQFNDLAMDNSGSFVVVWNGNGSGGDATGIHGRLFDSGGNPQGSEFQINTNTGNTQQGAAVAMTKTGQFVVTWQSDLQDGDGFGIFARQFDNTGASVGGELMVNTTTVDDQALPDAAIKAGDEFVVVWQGKGQDAGPPADSWGVFGQRYTSGINTAPVITLPGGALNYTENDPATIIDAGATVTDADSPDFDTGTLTIDFAAGGTLNDRLAVQDVGTGPGEIGVTGSDITYEGTVIGSFSGGSDGLTPLSITFNSSADATAVQELLRHITYRNVSDDPATGSRTLRVIMDDGDGSTSTPVTKIINVAAVNDAPVVSNVATSATEDGAPVAGSFSVTDPDASDTHTFTITAGPAEGSVVNNNDGTFTFDPGAGFQDLAAGETRNVSFSYKASDGSTDSAADATVIVTVTGTNDAPVVSNVSVNATEDGAPVAGGFGVTDPDSSDTQTFTITAGPAEGSVVNNNDGTFTFDPGAGFQDLAAGETRDVTFTYKASDGSTDSAADATVTVTVTGTNDAPVIVTGGTSGEEGGTSAGDENIALPGQGSNADKPVDAKPATGQDATDGDEPIAMAGVMHNSTPGGADDSRHGTYTEALRQLSLAGDESLNGHSRYSFTRVDGGYTHHDSTTRSPDGTGFSLLSSLKKPTEPDSGLWNFIEEMKNQMSERQAKDESMVNLLAKSATGMTLTLTAGIATWALRGGSVLAGMLSSVPLWKGFDPLPIIAASRKKREEPVNGNADATNEDERKAADMFDPAAGDTDWSARERGNHD